MTTERPKQVKQKPPHKGQHIHRPTTNWVTHKSLRSPPALNGLPVNVTTIRHPQFSLLSNEIKSVSVQEKRLAQADNRLRGSGPWRVSWSATAGCRRRSLRSLRQLRTGRLRDQKVRCRNKLKSKPTGLSVNKSVKISPTTVENLKPCPEHGLAMSTCGECGCRSIQKCSSGV